MVVYDVFFNDEFKETITPLCADLVSLYGIMKNHWLPVMTKKYGQAVKLIRRETAANPNPPDGR